MARTNTKLTLVVIASALALAVLLVSLRKEDDLQSRDGNSRTVLLGWSGQNDRDRFYDAARKLGSDTLYEDDSYPLGYDLSSVYPQSNLPPSQPAAFSEVDGYLPVEITQLTPELIDSSSGLRFQAEPTQTLAMIPATKQRVSFGEILSCNLNCTSPALPELCFPLSLNYCFPARAAIRRAWGPRQTAQSPAVVYALPTPQLAEEAPPADAAANPGRLRLAPGLQVDGRWLRHCPRNCAGTSLREIAC